jgi:ubiquitin-protein ligase
MDSYNTFFNRKLPDITVSTLETEFGIKIDTESLSVENSTNFEPRPSICSCWNQKSSEVDNESNYKPINDDNSFVCVICQSKTDSTSSIVGSYGCEHYYHFACIQKWLATNNKCPLCNTQWKLKEEDDTKIIIKLSDGMVEFDRDNGLPGFCVEPTESDVCTYFGVDSTIYRLNKNGVHFDKCVGGFYGLCTRDMHDDASCIEIILINSINSETKKTHAKSSTKISEFKSDIAYLFGILMDHNILIYNGIELSSELDNLNLFNVGIANESTITIMPNKKLKFKVETNNNFVVLYSDSNTKFDHSDPIRRILAGRSSWYPSAYLTDISDSDISCLLSSLYCLLKIVNKDEELTLQTVSKFGAYLELYQMHSAPSMALKLLLTLDDGFNNCHRTMISMSFYELIQKMKFLSNVGDSNHLANSNILCNLLIGDSVEQINWTYAKKNVSVQKKFAICSPLALNKLPPPVLIVDSNSMIAVYIGKNKDVERPALLYQPLLNIEMNVNPAILAKNMKCDVDDRIIDEAIMVCIDISNSMGGCSDFIEDKNAEKLAKTKKVQDHYKIWDEMIVSRNIIDDDVRLLKNAVIWFVTHPNLDDWKKRYGCLRQIVCLENRTNGDIATYVSKYRNIFFTLYDKKSVEIDHIHYTSSQNEKSYPNIPPDYLCPISQDIMPNPVILDDGFSYERENIVRWLEKSSISPMTGEKISKKMIPNKTLKSAISMWIEKQSKKGEKVSNQTNVLTNQPFQIIRENEDSLYYDCAPDANVYDLIYYLYTKHQMNLSTYTLVDTSGYSITNKNTLLSKLKNRIVLKKINSSDTINIKIVRGCKKTSYNTKKITVPKKSNLKNVIYCFEREYDYDMCQFYTGLKLAGDNSYNGSLLHDTYVLTEDITVHIFNEIPSSSRSTNYFSRLDIVKKLFGAFIDRSIAYGFNTAVGLMSFNDTTQLVNPITLSYENFRDKLDDLKNSGSTSLYNCLFEAIEHLVEWKKVDVEKRSNAKLRIICLTDGSDTSNIGFDKILEIKSMLKTNSIILDCIMIGDDYDRQLTTMSSNTNGYVFNPSSIAYGFNIMELETLITSLNRGKVMFYKSIDEQTTPPMKEPEKMTDLSVEIGSFNLVGESTHLQKELIKMIKNQHPEIDIYVNEKDMTFWKIIFTGPSSTPYTGGTWLAYMQFPKTYPLEPPEIRMVTSIKHCNINGYGRICHSILDRNYVSSISVRTILDCVYGLFLNPDITDPLDTNLAMMYYEANGEYEASIIKHVQKYAYKSRVAWRDDLVCDIDQ